MKTSRWGMLAVITIAALAVQAQAATVSYSQVFSQQVPQPQLDVGDLPLFDATLGTLQSVELSLDATASGGSITWDNESSIITDINLGIGAEVAATTSIGSVFNVIVVPLQSGTQDDVAADVDGVFDPVPDFVGADSFTVSGGVGSDTDSQSTSDPIDLAAFTGTGNFDVFVESLLETLVGASGGFGFTDTTPGQVDGTVTVTYTYDEPNNPVIPVPAALPVGLGLMGLIIARRGVKKIA